MKTTIHVCDICKKNTPNTRIKYKYKAKKFWYSWYNNGWKRIELCQDCLDKIIQANVEVEK